MQALRVWDFVPGRPAVRNPPPCPFPGPLPQAFWFPAVRLPAPVRSPQNPDRLPWSSVPRLLPAWVPASSSPDAGPEALLSALHPVTYLPDAGPGSFPPALRPGRFPPDAGPGMFPSACPPESLPDAGPDFLCAHPDHTRKNAGPGMPLPGAGRVPPAWLPQVSPVRRNGPVSVYSTASFSSLSSLSRLR